MDHNFVLCGFLNPPHGQCRQWWWRFQQYLWWGRSSSCPLGSAGTQPAGLLLTDWSALGEKKAENEWCALVHRILSALSYMGLSSASLWKNEACPLVYPGQPWYPATQGGSTILHLKQENMNEDEFFQKTNNVVHKANSEKGSACYLVLHFYQCVQWRLQLNPDLVRPQLSLPLMRKQIGGTK